MIVPAELNVEAEGWSAVQPFKFEGTRYIAVLPQVFLPPSSCTFMTVISTVGQSNVSAGWLSDVLALYRSHDDVFTDGFLQGVIFTYTGVDTPCIETDAEALLESLGTKVSITHRLSHTSDFPRPGPYCFSRGALREICRLYEDDHGAFINALTLDPQRNPLPIRIAGENLEMLCIPVPSRLRGLGIEGKDLSGLRIAVKDNFQFKGIRTSLCNKAYYELYPPSERTAGCIQDLYDLGAVVVGTTKLASFAATEEPVECVDYQAPWNPRADGYQSPAGSSSGSGVAVSAYEWVDISIGSDSMVALEIHDFRSLLIFAVSGSGRRPGHWNGCFAMRPTHGILSHSGFIPSFPQFDVPTFFGRDLDLCQKFAKHWYGEGIDHERSRGPISIVYATDYMSLIKNKSQLDLINSFTSDLEASLGAVRDDVSFEDVWKSTAPPEADGASLLDFMKDACRNSFFYDDHHNFDVFRKDYRAKFSKNAYVSPPVRWQWDLASKIDRGERDVAIEKLATYREWFSSRILQPEERTTLILIPIEEISPRYRDEMPEKHFNPVGIPNIFLSPILGAPELTIPIGQYSYESKVTGNTEQLPIAISIIAAPGRDLDLFDLARECLVKSGRPRKVLAGHDLFPL